MCKLIPNCTVLTDGDVVGRLQRQEDWRPVLYVSSIGQSSDISMQLIVIDRRELTGFLSQTLLSETLRGLHIISSGLTLEVNSCRFNFFRLFLGRAVAVKTSILIRCSNRSHSYTMVATYLLPSNRLSALGLY
jgi:hypothetical protein